MVVGAGFEPANGYPNGFTVKFQDFQTVHNFLQPSAQPAILYGYRALTLFMLRYVVNAKRGVRCV